MAYSLTANITTRINATHNNALDLVTYSGGHSHLYERALTTANVDLIWSDQRTIAGTEVLDVLTDLTDAYGVAMVFGAVRTVLIYNSHSTATLFVGGGSNALFNEIPITGGGHVVLSTNLTTSTIVRNIRVTAVTSVTYDIILIGSVASASSSSSSSSSSS